MSKFKEYIYTQVKNRMNAGESVGDSGMVELCSDLGNYFSGAYKTKTIKEVINTYGESSELQPDFDWLEKEIDRLFVEHRSEQQDES